MTSSGSFSKFVSLSDRLAYYGPVALALGPTGNAAVMWKQWSVTVSFGRVTHSGIEP